MKNNKLIIGIILFLVLGFFLYNQNISKETNMLEVKDYDADGNLIQSTSVKLSNIDLQKYAASSLVIPESAQEIELPPAPANTARRQLTLVIENTGNIEGSIDIGSAEYISIQEVSSWEDQDLNNITEL